MKKALSIILCLAMLMSTVPVSVFAAPAAVTNGDTAEDYFVVEPATDESAELQEEDSDAELAADTVSPVSVKPKNGATVDRRYPVAYYTFGSNVVINAADVTLENINNDDVGGVYFEEETNTIWVFPTDMKATVYANNKVTYSAWTSNIATADGTLLYFPGVSFDLEEDMPSDGENLVPFGDNEYGWTPFTLKDADSVRGKNFGVAVDPTNENNLVTYRNWEAGTSKWPHAVTEVSWKPNTTYKISARVMAKDFVNDSGVGGFDGSTTITPDIIYYVPSFSCTGNTVHDGQTGTTCSKCGAAVDREHATSFTDHTVNTAAANISVSGGVSDGWQNISFEITTRANLDTSRDLSLSLYSNPSQPYATEFYIDDVAVYEKVSVSFAAGRNSELKRRNPQTLKGYNGDVVTLPNVTQYYQVTNDNYVLDGWTDGENVYASGSSYTIAGEVVLTPNAVPAGEGYKVTFTVDEQFAALYNGPASLVISVGEELDLTADEFALGKAEGYVLEGWKNTATGETVTVVSGAADETIALEAAYSPRTGIVIDSAAKLSELNLSNLASAVYDDAVKGVVATPKNADPMVYFGDLAINTNNYSYVDITYVNNSDLASSKAGEVYFIVTGMSSYAAGYNANAELLSTDGDKVTYRYNLAANANWAGVCSSLRIDPYNKATPFTICEIQFVEDEPVASVDVTGVTAPVLSEVPNTAAEAGNSDFVIENVSWSPAANYFAGSTEYTVSVRVKVSEINMMFTEATTATINGNEAVIVIDELSSDYATVSYTFEATDPAKEVVVTMTNASEITENNGTLELAGTVTPAWTGDVIVPDTLTWSIKSGSDIAELNGNVLTAIWDGTVVVTATPDYDEEQAKDFEITISGQVGYNVTYDKATGAEVSGMPENERAKKNYTVTSAVPERSGYAFDGWTLAPGADAVVKELVVTKDVTLYAKWVKGGYVIEFNNPGDTVSEAEYKINLADGNNVVTSGLKHTNKVDIDREKGEAIFEIGGTVGNDFYITVNGVSGHAPNLDYVSAIEYGFRTDATGTFRHAFYFTTKDPVTGSWIAADNALEANRINPTSTAVDGNVNKYVVTTVDTSISEVWKGELGMARLDIENSNQFIGKTLYVDYIKFVGADSVEDISLNITAPKASDELYGVDAVTAGSSKYVVKSIEWAGPELVEGKYYAQDSVYTATVEIEAADGYVLSDVPASVTVNGEEAEIVCDGETATVTFEFPATEKLVDFMLQVGVEDNAAVEITTAYGTLQLTKKIYAAAGVIVPNHEVYWSISEDQARYASVDENGVVTANLDCEELIVTATSKYNPTVKATISIKISGQVPESIVTYAAGTGEEVTGLPENDAAKGKYTLVSDVIPERSGYAFKGWTKELGGEIITEDEVYEDVTYYAAWGYARGEHFEGKTSDIFTTKGSVTNIKRENSILSLTPTNAMVNEGILLQAGSGVFKDGLGRLSTGDYGILEIKTNIAPDTLELCCYVQTGSVVGSGLTVWNESANARFYSNTKEITNNPSHNIFDYVTKSGDWYIYRLPTNLLKNWNNYLNQIRLNFIMRNPDVAAYEYVKYPADFVAKFDYIRFIGEDVPAMDIVGVSVPEAKGEASTDATPAQDSLFKVTSVSWSPELLGGMYFDSATEYTVTMNVEALKGVYSLSNPPARVTVNGFDAEYTRTANKKATITYTFPATEDIGEIELVSVTLHEVGVSGPVSISQAIFAGDDFDLDKITAKNAPVGYRWVGWSETEGGEPISGTINITETADYYALYEQIESYVFTNKYHANETNLSVTEGKLKLGDGWAVVTPDYADAATQLTLSGMTLKASDYDYVEVIFDGSLEDANNENKFAEGVEPVLTVSGSVGSYQGTIVSVEPVIASNRVSYKYTFDIAVDGRPSDIKSMTLAPYAGFPAWGVTSVVLVPNVAIEEAVAITGIKAPETWYMPDVSAEASENYEITNIKWTCANGFNDDGSFKSESAYTVEITVKPAKGYKITVADATIDGNAPESAVINEDGTLTVKYTFPATDALVDFTLEIADAEITTPDGTVTLVPVFTPAVDIQTVTWEITENGPEGKSATIDENGVVKAFYNGTVKVKATADYNPLITAEATVTITNQVSNYTVTFDPNTKSNVTNMPDPVEVKLDYVLPTEAPVRPGFSFAGWVKSPEDTVSVSKDYITADTTYYALWVRGLHYEFFDANENSDKTLSMGTVVYNTIDTENGVLTFQPKLSNYNSLDTTLNIQNNDKSPLFKGSEYTKIVIRMTSTMASAATHKVYFTSKNDKGGDLVPSYSEANAVYTKASVGPDGYTDIVIDMSGNSNWTNGNITSIRFDPLDGGASLDHLNAVMSIDYIRVVSYETNTIEITGVDVPVAKAVADTTAESKDESKYEVTNVYWEGGLLYDNYFDGEKEYTVCVTVKGALGYCVSDAPSKATINGKTTDVFEYNAATGELTVKYTFPATGVLDNSDAYNITLVGKDDNGADAAEIRKIFAGDEFAIGTYKPVNIPSGKRWIGWSEEAGSTVNTVGESITVTEDKTYYAVFEDLVEFDYSNYYHTFGTTASLGGKISFKDGLAYMTVASSTSDAALITPSMNIDAAEFSFVEVYYSAFVTSYLSGVKLDNKFTANLRPALKFSTVDNPTGYDGVGSLVSAERVTIDNLSYYKYTYDMTADSTWSGKIACLYADPYNGYPDWGVRLIKLVPNEVTSAVAEIELTAPEAMFTADITDNVTVNEEYEIIDVSWTPDDEVFAAETSYTVSVTYKTAAGYTASLAAATIAGEQATVTDNGNGTFTAKVTFAATDALKETKVTISGAKAINSAGRYLQLKAETVAVDGTALPVTAVTWSVANKNSKIESALAKISENGRVYPISNGTVVVTATSVYDPSVSATHEIVISNQADLCTVTFDKNTQAEVSGMPESVQVIGAFVPEAYSVTRDGFFLLGWSTDEDALTPDKSFNITEDTVLYAKWGAGYEWSFDNAATALSPAYRDVTYSDGIATYGPNTNANSSGQIVFEKNGLNTLGIETASHQTIEIRLSLPTASQVKYYLRSSTVDGAELSPWNESANTNSIAQDLKPANASGDFQIVSYNLSGHNTWNMYPVVERIRLDLPQAGPEGGVKIDYIRLLSSERTVKFDANGGLIPLYGGEVTSFKETYSTGSINLPEDPSREGYEFIGWAKKTEDYTKLYNNKFTVTDDVTLYAIWTPAAVLDEETVAAGGAEVTANEDGTVTITSEEATTPVITVADSVDVTENSVVVVKVNGSYKDAENGDVVLTFVDENGDPQNVVISTDGVSGETTITYDLADDGYTGTITDVVLTLPTGVIESVTVESVAFAAPEVADMLTGDADKDVVSINPSVITTVGGKQDTTGSGVNNGNIYPAGSGSVTENTSSTTKTPADKKVNVPARPKDDSTITGGDNNKPGTTTPSTPSKFSFTQKYDGRFVDVKEANWFYSDVEKSFRLGLMNGKSATTFVPDGTVTLAEAITVAARMNAIYNGQTITQGTGNSWYQPYVDYAIKKAIITNGQYSDYTALATREQVAVIFVRALPSSWYTQMNLFLTIPDVPSTSASFAAIQRLYNAGVITGVDDKYNFKPKDNIKRSELSAIINRVALVDSRLRVVTEDEKNSNIKIFDTATILNTLKVGNCGDNTWQEKNGGAYAVPSKADPVVNGLQDLLGGTVDADLYKKVTVVIRSESAGVSGQAQMFFWSDTVQLSEANSVRVNLPKADAEGNISIVFEMNKNAAWKGTMTNLRFDPFNAMFDFSIVSIKFE